MVRPFSPAVPRESMAMGVSRAEAARRASAMPGRRRSHQAAVASGVTSRGPMPVPPVVRMKSASACRPKAARMAGSSSATISRRSTAAGKRARSTASISGPERSS